MEAGPSCDRAWKLDLKAGPEWHRGWTCDSTWGLNLGVAGPGGYRAWKMDIKKSLKPRLGQGLAAGAGVTGLGGWTQC